MPSVKEHIPLAVVTIVLSIAVFILFKEVRGLRGHVATMLQQPPVAYIPQLSAQPLLGGEGALVDDQLQQQQLPPAPSEDPVPSTTPLPPKVTSKAAGGKAKAP